MSMEVRDFCADPISSLTRDRAEILATYANSGDLICAWSRIEMKYFGC